MPWAKLRRGGMKILPHRGGVGKIRGRGAPWAWRKSEVSETSVLGGKDTASDRSKGEDWTSKSDCYSSNSKPEGGSQKASPGGLAAIP